MELKPCPFCGHEASILGNSQVYIIAIGCTNEMCNIRPRAMLRIVPELVDRKELKKQAVIKIWNTRK